MSSGLLAFLSDGTWSKRLHPGWAAHGGVTAAGLALHGFRGPSAILEDRYGTYASFLYGESVDPIETVRDLGTRWVSVPPHVKRYPCAHVIQPFLDIVLGVGLRAATIDHLELRVPRWQAPIVCEPWETKTRPATEYQARTSLPFAVALALVDGEVGIDSFGDDALHRHDLHDVLARVGYAIDDQLADFEVVVVVRYRDGATATHAVSVDEPAPADVVRTKLPSTAGRVLGPELVAELAAGLHRCDSQDPFDPVAFVGRCASRRSEP